MRRAIALLYCLLLLSIGVGAAYYAVKHGLASWPTEGSLRDKALAGGLIGVEVLGAWALTLIIGFTTAKTMFAAVIKTVRFVFMTVWAGLLLSSIAAIFGAGYIFGESRASGLAGAVAFVAVILIWWGGQVILGRFFPDHRRPIIDNDGWISGHAA